MSSIDRPPDLVAEFRSMKARIAELEAKIFNRVVAAARVTGGSTILHNTPTVASFSSVDFDTGGLFNAGAPDRLTAPIAGMYMLVGTFNMGNNAVGDRQVTISGSDSAPTTGAIVPAPVNTFFSSIPRTVELDAGDYQQLTGFQTSGSTLATSFSLTMFLVGALP